MPAPHPTCAPPLPTHPPPRAKKDTVAELPRDHRCAHRGPARGWVAWANNSSVRGGGVCWEGGSHAPTPYRRKFGHVRPPRLRVCHAKALQRGTVGGCPFWPAEPARGDASAKAFTQSEPRA